MIKSYLQLGSATDVHPACPNKKQNHLQKSLLRRTHFWVRKSFSKPASLKRASLVAIPVAISHKASLKPKGCTSDTLIQNFKLQRNEPKPARSHRRPDGSVGVALVWHWCGFGLASADRFFFSILCLLGSRQAVTQCLCH